MQRQGSGGFKSSVVIKDVEMDEKDLHFLSLSLSLEVSLSRVCEDGMVDG